MKVTRRNDQWVALGKPFTTLTLENVKFGRGTMEGELLNLTRGENQNGAGQCKERLFLDFDGFHSEDMKQAHGTFCEETQVKTAKRVFVTQTGVWAQLE